MAVVVAEAGSYSSDWTPSLGTSICHRYSPKKTKRKKKDGKNNDNDEVVFNIFEHLLN